MVQASVPAELVMFKKSRWFVAVIRKNDCAQVPAARQKNAIIRLHKVPRVRKVHCSMVLYSIKP